MYLQCIKFIAQFADFEIINNVSTFFDDKEGFRGEAIKIYDNLKHRFQGKIAPPVFRNMRKSIPLQVADIIAYESKKEFERQLEKPNSKPRWGFFQPDELLKKATGRYPLVFGDETSPIALISNTELKTVSSVQKEFDIVWKREFGEQ